MREVYLDNAATTRYKPQTVIDKMTNFMTELNCSPGRGGYECAIQAGREIMDTRFLISDFFNAGEVESILFTKNVTESLNILIKGLLKEGDHVVTTSLEHNAALRPLNQLEEKNIIEVSYVQADKKGILNPSLIEEAIQDNTKLIILNHASNVTGTILPAEEVGKIAKKHDIFYALDTAQTAGVIDINFKKFNLDFLGFTGHKSLLGPQGTGGMAISERLAEEMETLIAGGTGSMSETVKQPDFLPDKFESGTLNTPGIIGLKAGIEYINKVGIKSIHNHEIRLLKMFLDELKNIDKITVYGSTDINKKVPTVPLTIKGYDLGELGFKLAEKFGIMVRSGLHCAPLAHKTIGTFPDGALRFSIGWHTTEEDIEYTLETLAKL
ncbi:MAG TPA: aminotransferase class V-fold PLP-dependent enzyme [Halanaerobiales bacterium]|nr:aminotransferase class V-fold PLP-dependent enzyme [Halanaerobiales bacterium]